MYKLKNTYLLYLRLWVVFAVGCFFSLLGNAALLDNLNDENRLEVIDARDAFPKHIFLRDNWLSIINSYWIDNERLLVQEYKQKKGEPSHEAQPNVVIVNTNSGAIDTVLNDGLLVCYSDGKLRINTFGNLMFAGKLGEKLTEYKSFPKGKQTNNFDCDFLDAIKPLPEAELADYTSGIYLQHIYPLKAKHGRLVFWEHRYSQYEELTTSKLFLQEPNGERVDIPLELGEGGNPMAYIPFEDAYLLRMVWRAGLPNKDQYDFADYRLLYPSTGLVKRLRPHELFRAMVRRKEITGSIVGYTRLGLLYVAETLPPPGRVKIFSKIKEDSIYYLDYKDHLLRVEGANPSPDGCKLIGHKPASFTSEKSPKFDYFVINICEGK